MPRTHAPPHAQPQDTVASTWRAASGLPVADDLLTWPPDVLALTEVLLERSQAYRFLLSPPEGVDWTPGRSASWSDAVQAAAVAWSAWATDPREALPELLAQEWALLCASTGVLLEDLAQGRNWRVCQALMTLHAVADEACAGLGIALDRSTGEGCVFRGRGRELLARTGSASRIDPQRLRVLPKLRTPANGSALGALSRYASVHGPGVGVLWHKVPGRHPSTTNASLAHFNALLLPWPLRVREADFHPLEGSVRHMADEAFGLFTYDPAEPLDLDLVHRTLLAALDETGSVDSVFMPESAVREEDIDALEAVLDSHGVTALVAGVRGRAQDGSQLPGNWVHSGMSPKLEKGSSRSGPGEQWVHVRQNKHHRWMLDAQQIGQYHLGGVLHPSVRWLEAMDVPRKTLEIREVADGMTVVALVCEDLAQNDDVAQLLRAVGPSLVLVPLMDGPQFTSRWAARYASVLADDPGSAVLTLSSYGMVRRSRPPGRDPSSVIALWKDPSRGVREISLDDGAHGVLLTACGTRTPRTSGDGRWPVYDATNYAAASVHQVRASAPDPAHPRRSSLSMTPCVLDIEDVTVLTNWAEAIAEAMAYAPVHLAAVLSDASAGAGWREPLGLSGPSPALCTAVATLVDATRATSAPDPPRTFDSVVDRTHEVPPNEGSLERVARLVLRSKFEQLRARRVSDAS